MLRFLWNIGAVFLILSFASALAVLFSFHTYPVITKPGAISLLVFGNLLMLSSLSLLSVFILLKFQFVMFLIPLSGLAVSIYAFVRFAKIWHRIKIIDRMHFHRHKHKKAPPP